VAPEDFFEFVPEIEFGLERKIILIGEEGLFVYRNGSPGQQRWECLNMRMLAVFSELESSRNEVSE